MLVVVKEWSAQWILDRGVKLTLFLFYIQVCQQKNIFSN